MSANPQPEPDDFGIEPGILRSMQAYWRDLPQLVPLRSRKREWVVYHGDERVGFARTQAELYQECFRRGIPHGEFYVGRLRMLPEPPWEPIEIEPRYELDDDDDLEAFPEEPS
jgi:hypothetical protein